jgi:hypothetical protein
MIAKIAHLEPLWAFEKSPSNGHPQNVDYGSKQPPTAFPTRLNLSSVIQKSNPRISGDEDAVSQDTASRFGSALPTPSPTPTIQDTVAKTIELRKDHVKVTPPALALQPRRPQMRCKLAPHEPHIVEPHLPINGSTKRVTHSSSSSSSASSGNGQTSSGSQKLVLSPSGLNQSGTIANDSNPNLSTNFKSSGTFFGLGGSIHEGEDEISENLSDEQLFRELLAHSIAEYELDLPLCCECAPAYFSNLQLQVEDVDREILDMETFLASFPTPYRVLTNLSQYNSEMEQLQQEYDKLVVDFDQILLKSGQQQQAIETCDIRDMELQVLKDDYWKRYCRFKHEDMCQQDVYGTVKARLMDKTKYLEMLRTSCGLNDAFNISFSGHYALINGLRLGLKSPTLKSTVDWDEISAAFGFLSFLFVKLGTALSHNWQTAKYRIRSDGSFSTVIQPKEGVVHNLFVDKESSWSLLRFRDQNSFDKAFEVFVRCFDEVSSPIFKREPQFKMPFPITLDPLSMGGLPVVTSRNNPEQWTHFAKQLAINIKTVLKWLVAQGNVK